MAEQKHPVVYELAKATRRRTPILSKRVLLSACIGCFATAVACIYSTVRIRESEEDFHALQRSQLESIASQLMSSIQRQLETSVSSTRALSALIHLDEAQKMLEPLGDAVEVLYQKSSAFAELPFNADSGMTQEQTATYDAAEKAKVDAANEIIFNASKLGFNTVADSLIATYKGISNLQLAPGGIVSAIHPLRGNEAAMGHDLFFDPKRRDGAMETIRTGGIVFVGPVTLIQNGKRAIIARNPTFINKPGFVGKYFEFPSWWGFTTMVCGLDDLFAATPLINSEDFRVSYILYARTATGIRFLKASDDVPDHSQEKGEDSIWYIYAMGKQPVTVDFKMDELHVHWEMMAWPRDDWQSISDTFMLQVLLCTFFTICSLVSMYSMLVRESVMQQVASILEQHDAETPKEAWNDNAGICLNPSPPPTSKLPAMPMWIDVAAISADRPPVGTPVVA